MSPVGQMWLAWGLMVAQAVGELLLAVPIEKAIAQNFDETKTENEGDHV